MGYGKDSTWYNNLAGITGFVEKKPIYGGDKNYYKPFRIMPADTIERERKMFKKKFARQDPETGEWFFNGKYYEDYPGKEVEEYNSRYDEYMETKFQERRDGEDDSKSYLFGKGDR